MTPETELLPIELTTDNIGLYIYGTMPDGSRNMIFDIRVRGWGGLTGQGPGGRKMNEEDAIAIQKMWADEMCKRWNRPAPKAIDVEALKREVFKHFCPAFLNYDPYACIPVSAMIDHLNSRGLFGQVDQVAVDALKKINAMPYYLEPVPESQISSLVKRYNKCLDIAEETLQALEKTDD